MAIGEETYGGYICVAVSLNALDDKQLIEAIESKAREMRDKVNKKAPDGKIRSKELIYWNNLGGELAQRAVESYLYSLIKEHNVKARIISQVPQIYDYQTHRDIIIEVNGIMKTLEVRSSFNYKTSFERVLSGAFSLIGPYRTSYKGKEPDKDFYITVVHRCENWEIENKLKNNVKAYIAGGASKEIFEEYGTKEMLKQEGAEYLIIRPINSVVGVPTLFKEILEIK